MFNLKNLTEEEQRAYDRYKELKYGRIDLTTLQEKNDLFLKYRIIRHFESDYPKYFVDPYSLPSTPDEDLEQYFHLINSSKDEGPIQKFFNEKPYFIASILKGTQFGHHSTYAFSQFALANKYRTDYALCGRSSEGHGWVFIELQSPNCNILNKNGTVGPQAREGLEQISSWREWFRNNMEYARSKSGLNMIDLHEGMMQYVLIVGCRKHYSEEENNWRKRQMAENRYLTIMSYDRVADFYKELMKTGNF